MSFFDDGRYMRAALDEARKALLTHDVPIGAVAVRAGVIIGRGHNRREADGDPTAHAEMLAIREAAAALGEWRLDGVTLYVTLEPCCMCAGAIVLARIPRVVYGAVNPKGGCAGSIVDLLRHPAMTHQVDVFAGVQREACGELLQGFFEDLR